MKVYFLRHGDAVERSQWAGEESLRPLSQKGEQDIRLEGRRFAGLKLDFGLVVSSPYARALRTAALAVSSMEKPPAISADRRLEPGFGVEEFNSILADSGDIDSILLVGHEPDFSETIGRLVGGARLDVKKGALARVDIVPDEPCAILALLVPPAYLA